MHVVQLTDFYRPTIGGLERHVETLSRELIRLGHTVTVVTLQTGDQPEQETLDLVRVIRIRGWISGLKALYSDSARPFHPTIPDPGAVAALHRVIELEHPAVVHSHSWFQYSYLPLHHAQHGPAHVVTLHDYGLSCAKKTLEYIPRRPAVSGKSASHEPGDGDVAELCSGPRLAKCLPCASHQYGLVKAAAITAGLRGSRALHSRVDRYIAISNAVAHGSRHALPSDSEIVVVPTMVPNGLAALAQSTSRPTFLPAEDGYLMFVGTLGRHKGVNVLLEAWRKMRNRLPLVLIGTPRPDTPPINDPGITIARNVPSAQVMAAWTRASVAVVPSLWHEPLGQVAVEAMLVGRPVVASDVGGLRDVVEHGVTGLVVRPGDPHALAAALDRLVDDPALRRRMGEIGRERARQFEAAAVTPRIVEVFEDVLQQRTLRTQHR